MLKVGISSNIKKYYKGYIDFIDHYWIKIFERKKINYSLLPNNLYLSKKILKKNNLLILTGGNDIISNKKDSKIRNKIENNLIKEAIKLKIPIIGICRGAQLINLYFGGKIRKISSHMRTRHNIFLEKNNIIKINKLNVNSFHNYGIAHQDLSKKLKAIGVDKQKNIEMYELKKNKILGIMWHPERESNHKILLKLINFYKK